MIMKHAFALLISAIVLVVGVNLLKNYFSPERRELLKQIAALEKLKTAGVQTTAQLGSVAQPAYPPQLSRLPHVSQKQTYQFVVGSTTYAGSFSGPSAGEANTVLVTYLPSNPAINAQNPEQEAAFLGLLLKEEYRAEPVNGLIFITLACVQIFFSVRAIRRSRQLAAEEEMQSFMG